MIYGMMPFTSSGNNEDQLKKEIQKSEVVYTSGNSDETKVSDECKALLKKILKKENGELEKRLTPA